jgi:hypothetical protein
VHSAVRADQSISSRRRRGHTRAQHLVAGSATPDCETHDNALGARERSGLRQSPMRVLIRTTHDLGEGASAAAVHRTFAIRPHLAQKTLALVLRHDVSDENAFRSAASLGHRALSLRRTVRGTHLELLGDSTRRNLMTFRKLVGLAAIGGFLYQHKKRGGAMTLDGFKQTARGLFDDFKGRAQQFKSQAEQKLDQSGFGTSDVTPRSTSVDDVTGYGSAGYGYGTSSEQSRKY